MLFELIGFIGNCLLESSTNIWNSLWAMAYTWTSVLKPCFQYIYELFPSITEKTGFTDEETLEAPAAPAGNVLSTIGTALWAIITELDRCLFWILKLLLRFISATGCNVLNAVEILLDIKQLIVSKKYMAFSIIVLGLFIYPKCFGILPHLGAVIKATIGRNGLRIVQYPNEDGNVNKCVICMDRNRCIVLLPCRHFCMCKDCCQQLYGDAREKLCPLCRCDIELVIRVYV